MGVALLFFQDLLQLLLLLLVQLLLMLLQLKLLLLVVGYCYILRGYDAKHYMPYTHSLSLS